MVTKVGLSIKNETIMEEIIAIKRNYDEITKTMLDGVIVIIKMKNGEIKQTSISGSDWSQQRPGVPFSTCGVFLTEKNIEEINHILWGQQK